ncbi:glycosyltransferase family 4 protein [Desulfurococcaceae archaeon MEX13E-LK6-19]|nr:glycosyltransferase family 4 protein [Desulfurococcaceae archaeon MEX13E-LK6-19]
MVSRILVVSERYPPEGTGGSYATHMIVKLLAKTKKYRITVLTATLNPYRLQNVQYISIPYTLSSSKYCIWAEQIIKSNLIRKLINKHDIIYITDHSYILIPLAWKEEKKIIVHLHDYQPISASSVLIYWNGHTLNSKYSTLYYEILQKRSLARGIVSFLLSFVNDVVSQHIALADQIICVSNRQKELLISYMNGLKNKVAVIYNPIPDDLKNINSKINYSDYPIIAYMGGSNVIKGAYIALKAAIDVLRKTNNIKSKKVTFFMNILGKRDSSLKWQMGVGPIEIVDRIKNILAGNENLVITGWIDRKQYINLLQKSWAVLVPSLWEEPLPYVVMEAMVTGTIPLASRVGGIPEMVYNTPAYRFLFNPYNYNELQKNIESVTSLEKKEIEDIGNELIENAYKKFNEHIILNKLENVFN